jgi:hypothetical protein
MADTETVTLRLPSGEEFDAVVPAGMSDAQIKAYTVSKRPDLFAAAGKPLPGLSQPARPPLPQLSPSEEMPLSQASEDAKGDVWRTLGELGGPAAAGLAIAAGGASLPAIAARTLPPVTAGVKAIGVWAKANPEMAQALHFVLGAALKGVIGGAAAGATYKFVKSFPTPEK